MHKVLLGIGTNTDVCFNMEQAIDYLLSYFPSIKFTSTIKTEAYGENYTAPFLNSLAYFETYKSKDEVELKLKAIEKKMGRKTSHKTEGKIIIDIDLIKWDNEVLKPNDFKRDYMHELMLEVQKFVDDL
ncbi:MAG: hypothetical protein GX921_03125 [Bacteroidales bacterium]|nr:hypothetical protein [Bacteroidales bacterium]